MIFQINMSNSEDGWLSTRNKSRVPVKHGSLKKRSSLYKPKRPMSSGICMTQNSPPPKQLFTATKQSKLGSFFNVKDTDTSKVDKIPENTVAKKIDVSEDNSTIKQEYLSNTFDNDRVSIEIKDFENGQSIISECRNHKKKENVNLLSGAPSYTDSSGRESSARNVRNSVRGPGIKRLHSDEEPNENNKRLKLDLNKSTTADKLVPGNVNLGITDNPRDIDHDDNLVEITSNSQGDKEDICLMDSEKIEHIVKTHRNNEFVETFSEVRDTKEAIDSDKKTRTDGVTRITDTHSSFSLSEDIGDTSQDNSLVLETQLHTLDTETVSLSMDEYTELDLSETQDIAGESLDLCTQFTLNSH